MSSGGKRGNSRKREGNNRKKQTQEKELQDTNDALQGPSLSAQKIVLRSWFKDDQKIEVECPQSGSASPLSSDVQKLSEQMRQVVLTETDSDNIDQVPVSPTHINASLQEEKLPQPQAVKLIAKESKKKKSKNQKSQEVEPQQQFKNDEEKTQTSIDGQPKEPKLKDKGLNAENLKEVKAKVPSKNMEPKPKEVEQTPNSKEKPKVLKTNDVVPKTAKPKKVEKPQKTKEINLALPISKVETDLPKSNKVEQTKNVKEIKQNVPNESISRDIKPQVKKSKKVEPETQNLKEGKSEKVKPKPKELRAFTDEDLNFIVKKLNEISLSSEYRKDKFNPKRRKEKSKEESSEKVDFNLSMYRLILDRLSKGKDEPGCTCGSLLEKRFVNPNLTFEEALPELSENLFQVDEDFETVLLGAITMSVNNYHCGHCMKSNVDVYFKHVNFNRIMVFKCLNCVRILGENPVTDAIYVNDMKTKERKKTSNAALHFARTVANDGLTYKEASNILKLKNFPPITEEELHTLIRDLYCYLHGKCEDQKVTTSEVIKKHYKENGFRPSNDGLLDLAVFFFQIKVPIKPYNVLMAGFVIEVETGMILDMTTLEAHCRSCREFYIGKDKLSKIEIALWTATHGNECELRDKDGMKDEYHNVAILLFGRSKKMGFRYATLIANNISPNLKKLQRSGLYGDAHPINIISYLNFTAQKIERDLKLSTKSKRLAGDGDGALTATIAKTFGGLYKTLYTKSSGDFSLMRKSMIGVVFHHASTDETPLHQLCHRGFYCSFPTTSNDDTKKGWHRKNLTFSLNKKSTTTILTILTDRLSDDVLQFATGEPPMCAENIIDYIVSLVQKFRIISVDMIGYAYYKAFLVHNQRLRK